MTCVHLENTKTEADVRVGNVVVTLAQRIADGADVLSGRWPVGVLLDFVPDAVEIATCGVVVP